MKPDVLVIGRAFRQLPTITEQMARHFTIHKFDDRPLLRLSADVTHAIRAVATEANQGAERDLIAALPKLELVSVFGVGLDLVDLAAARARRIAVTNTPGPVGREVADLAIGLLLASARHIVRADRFVREGRWPRDLVPLGRSVHGKTLGIIGLGGLGRPIADRALAFGLRVLYHGPRRKTDAPYEYIANVIELAARSDFLVVASKGGPETRHLVSGQVIEALGPNGTLINVARGSIVDEAALVAALRTGKLGFAALDVFENAPNILPEFLTLPNVILQPHHGSATQETREAMGQQVIRNLVAHFERRALPDPVM
jgi:lactate dehydrogenase-like 2-hydroxyacid dehydrogenase